MMSPDSFPTKLADDNQSSGSGRKPTTTIKPSDQALKCPRCDSLNTKFCYYNNYSLTQPRHFCKTCRRYWTKGGALRNVPIGGGCRKSKKSRSASRLSGDQRDSDSPSENGNNKYFHGLSTAMEFPLGGLPFSRLHSNTSSVFNQYISFGDLSSTLPSPPTPSFETGASSGLSLVGFNYPISSVRHGESAMFNGGLQDYGSMNVHSSIASSIESLSSMNQDLHWKLQQQRLAMFLSGDNQKESSASVIPSLLLENQPQQQQQQQQQSVSFHTPESSKSTEICVSNSRKGCVNENTSEWFFENSYTATNNNINNNNNGNINNNTINWNGIQTWNDLHQYSVLP